MSDLLHETYAAGTENAAFIVERHARPEFNPFWLFNFLFQKTRAGRPELDAVFLEMTLAGLIANRAIERMIDQKKLHHPVPAFFDHRRIGSNPHAFRNILSARNLWPRDPVDRGFAISTDLRFSVRA